MTTIEFIDIIAPEHGRSSCSDDNLSNSFYFDEENKEQGRSRCIRCSLLYILELDKDLPKTFDFNKVIYG